jgi:RNA polymerase sigma-70 factor (ECF subfamily)
VTDAELVRAIQAGDATALQPLYERYLPAVWRFACHQLRNLHAAEDVVSETFLAAVRAVAGLEPEAGSVGGWLIGIARHKVGDHRRRTLRMVPCEEAVEAAGADPADAPDPAAGLEVAENREAVLRVMDRLPDDERLALEWKYIDGLSVGEVAGRLGRTEKAAEALLYRARQSFRDLYGRRERQANHMEDTSWRQ